MGASWIYKARATSRLRARPFRSGRTSPSSRWTRRRAPSSSFVSSPWTMPATSSTRSSRRARCTVASPPAWRRRFFEEVAYDEEGTPLTASFVGYLFPSAAELPSFELVEMETPTPVQPARREGDRRVGHHRGDAGRSRTRSWTRCRTSACGTSTCRRTASVSGERSKRQRTTDACDALARPPSPADRNGRRRDRS